LANPLWIFIGLSLAIFLVGYILGFIISFRQKHLFKKEIISLVSFQNAGYLSMNVALFLFSPVIREKFLVYIFLNLLGFNIIMWSVGSFFIFKKKGEKFELKSFFSPPIAGTVIALLLIYTHTARFLPSFLITPLKMIGETSFVLSAIVLGCWLAKVKIKKLSQRLILIAEVSFIKLIVVPCLFLLVLLKFEISSYLGFFIVLQAASPSAVSLPIIADLRGADSEFVSQGVFITHILGIVTIPFWLGMYLRLAGFSL